MGFQDAVKSFYRRFFDFETRSTRSEYWWVQLFMLIVYFIFFALFFGLAGATGGFDSEQPPAWFGLGMLVFAAFALANIIPAIAVTVRRFHDQDKSGWMYLLAFIPLVGGFVVLIFMILEGTKGVNRFGTDPLGRIGETFS